MPSKVLNTNIFPGVGEIILTGGPWYVYHPLPPPDGIAYPDVESWLNDCKSTSTTDNIVPLAIYTAAFPVLEGSSMVPRDSPPLTIISVPLNATSQSVSLVVICPVEKLNFVNSPDIGVNWPVLGFTPPFWGA